MPATAPQPLPPSALVRCEVGRSSPGEAQDWATWVSPLGGDGGDALYRSLVLADGAIAVAVELDVRGVAGTRTVHHGRCGLPSHPQQTAERVRLLLAAADRAAARALETHRGGACAAAAGRTRPSPRRVHDDTSRGAGGRDGGVSASRHERDDGLCEHARREAAAAA